MKKIMGLLLTLGMIMTLVGCGGNKEGAAEKFELKFGLTPGVQSNEYKAVKGLADYVAEKSGNRLIIKIYPDSQLGDDREMLSQVKEGSLDLVLAETGRLGLWVKEAEIFQLPYVFDNYDHLRNSLFKTAEGKNLLKKFEEENNWKILTNAYNGSRQTSSNKPIESIEDMKGMKLRVPNAQANLDYAKFVGASPTPMAFTEVYLALQTNAVDGQENPLSAIKSSKFYEVQSYIAMTNHIINDQNYIVGKSTWQKLPEDLQQILADGVEKAGKSHTEMFMNDEKNLINYFQENGVTITEPNLDAFKAALKPVHDEYVNKNGELGKKLLEAINSAR
ncbi:sialic acid TRAP transporter substrate-binding protein SiaP [Fusobacteria bacterium ZRK30]|nr:sialic acid TRAP transporter substrate-binding protein SiaP [Fusobacteria bacterium ZRK30]